MDMYFFDKILIFGLVIVGSIIFFRSGLTKSVKFIIECILMFAVIALGVLIWQTFGWIGIIIFYGCGFLVIKRLLNDGL